MCVPHWSHIGNISIQKHPKVAGCQTTNKQTQLAEAVTGDQPLSCPRTGKCGAVDDFIRLANWCINCPSCVAAMAHLEDCSNVVTVLTAHECPCCVTTNSIIKCIICDRKWYEPNACTQYSAAWATAASSANTDCSV